MSCCTDSVWSSTAVEHLTLTLGVLDWSEGLLLAGLNCPASVCKAVGLNNRTCACVLFVTSEAAAVCCCSAYVSTVVLFLALGRQLLTLTGFALFLSHDVYVFCASAAWQQHALCMCLCVYSTQLCLLLLARHTTCDLPR